MKNQHEKELILQSMDEEKKADALQELSLMNRHSFRIAYEFLERHFPPKGDADWWRMAVEDLKKVSTEESEMLMKLVCAVYGYLEWVEKVKEGTAE